MHAGEGSRRAVEAELNSRGRGEAVVHLVDPSLVDGTARVFSIDERRYEAIRARIAELAERVETIVLACSVYNGVARDLSDDLGVAVVRSGAAGLQALRGTSGPLGILLSYAPSIQVVVDYASEVFANDEDPREVRASLAADISPFVPPGVVKSYVASANFELVEVYRFKLA